MTAVLEGVSGQQHAPAASTPAKDLVPILQEAGWAPGLVWTGGKSRPHRDSIPDHPVCSQSLYRLNYRAHRYQGNSRNVRYHTITRNHSALMNHVIVLHFHTHVYQFCI